MAHGIRTSKTEVNSDSEDRDFMLQHIKDWDEEQEEFREVDREVLTNYMVLPRSGRESRDRRGLSGNAVLKDPETHQMIETLLAKMMLSMLSADGFISADPVGPEDAHSAAVVKGLCERNFRTAGNYRAQYVGLKDALLFGATTHFPFWNYREGERVLRTVEVDPYSGFETVHSQTIDAVLDDDLSIMSVDHQDFIGECGKDEVRKMLFAARRFTIPKFEALEKAESEGPWKMAAVQRAIDRQDERDTERGSDEWRRGIDRTQSEPHSNPYDQLVGYEGYGYTPHIHSDGARRRKITLLNGELVESRAMPLEVSRIVPFYDQVINPMGGRWRGISPGAVARYTQDFTDALLICLANAVVKTTDPPVIVKRYAQVDMDAVRRWRGPIRANDTEAVKELDYNPALAPAFNLLQGMKQQMREQSGALGQVQGTGFGTKRMSASETAFLAKNSMDRPELMMSLFEYEYLPALGLGSFELSQQFIESSEDLARRVGHERALERAPRLEDIMGQFDIKFIGSRRIKDKEAQLQFLERSMQVFASIPGAAPLYPWTEGLVKWLELADLRDIETMVGNPSGVEDFAQRAVESQGASGNGNGAVQRTPPLGLAPAQLGGGTV